MFGEVLDSTEDFSSMTKSFLTFLSVLNSPECQLSVPVGTKIIAIASQKVDFLRPGQKNTPACNTSST